MPTRAMWANMCVPGHWSGEGAEGKYFDCEQDIATVVGAGEDGLKDLYELKVEFLGGLPNDGGTASALNIET